MLMPWTRHGWFALARGFCPALASPVPMLAERRARGSAWPRVLQCTEEGTCSLAGDLHCSWLSVCRNRGCQQWKENMLGRSLPGEDRRGERQAGSPQAAVGRSALPSPCPFLGHQLPRSGRRGGTKGRCQQTSPDVV